MAKGEHFALIQQAGGTLNASTWLDRTNYFETLPSHELELALWLESDRLASLLPAMTQEKLDNQREVVKNERRCSVDNQPYGTWDERIQAHLFPEGHPYHHPTIGSMEDLNAASLEDVGEFFSTYYAPNNAVLTVAGDFDRDAALAMVERHFGPIPANDSLPPPPDMSIPPLIGEALREEVADRVPLPRIYVAYRMPIFGSDAFDDLSVAGDVLGVGRASRLYSRLVRERKLAQDISVFAFPIVGGASMFTHVGHRQAGGRRRSARDRAAGRGRPAGRRGADRRRARARRQPARRRRGVQPGAHRRARRPAVDVRLPVRPAGAHQHRGRAATWPLTPSAYGAPWPRPSGRTTGWC